MSNEMIAQRTPEWLEQRKLRITGSRVGAILGLSPWQTPDDVLRSMVREYHGAESEFEDNPAVQWGRDNETRALLAFMRKTGLQVEQCGFFEYGDRMGASPDGITSDGRPLELKVPFSCRNGAPFKPLSEQPHYYAQVQMEMLSTEQEIAYFAQYRAPSGDPLSIEYVEEAIEVETVAYDKQWWDWAHPKIDAFYKRLLAELDNSEHLEPLRITFDADEIIEEIDHLRKRQKSDSEREKELIAKLVEMADGKNAEVSGRKLTHIKSKGRISYAKAIKDLLPDADLEPYRGKESESWRLT